jgi:hypothetical protein
MAMGSYTYALLHVACRLNKQPKKKTAKPN